MRILVIEDELRMLELLRKGLYESGYTVMTAMDGEAGLKVAIDFEFDAIVLDIGLPRRDGYSVAHLLREQKSAVPILMLTARDTEDDIIRGLDIGADDYLTKPFSFPELLVRLQAITRPHRKDAEGTLEVGDVFIDLSRQVVTRNAKRANLTRHEFLLLVCLMRSAGRCIQRTELMESVWGNDHEVSAGTLDVLVNALRSKIDMSHKEKLIVTVRGSGYLFKVQTATSRRSA
jgi:DNA-binding response OmpR family regulator